MRSGWLIACFILGFNLHAFSQIIFEEPPEEVSPREAPISSIYGEIFGNAYSLSLNYDYIGKKNVGFRVGITPIFLFDPANDKNQIEYDDTYSQSFQLLIMANYFIGKSTNRLELGAGFVFGFNDNNVDLGVPAYPAFSGTVGYRLLPNQENITIKLAFTPIFSGDEFFPRFGFSLGYIF